MRKIKADMITEPQTEEVTNSNLEIDLVEEVTNDNTNPEVDLAEEVTNANLEVDLVEEDIDLADEEPNTEVSENAIEQLMEEVNAQNDTQEVEEEKEKTTAEEKLMAEATYEEPGEINPRRQYDERHRTVSLEAKQLVNDAGNSLHYGALEFKALKIDKIGEEDCLIVYIPDPITGVKGILPKRLAGLKGRETLEYLMRLPKIRVTPIKVDKDGEKCILNRELAERISGSKTWREVNEGNDVEAVVRGFKRNPTSKSVQKILLDIGSVEAFMDRNEISHNYVSDEQIKYRIGDTIKVRVIMKSEFTVDTDDPEKPIKKRRFLVSVRAMTLNAWLNEDLIPKIREKCNGTIKHVSERFVHVQLPTMISVICHRPSLNYADRERIKVGNEIQIYITGVDRERRIAFGNMSKLEMEKDIRRRSRAAARRIANS